MAWGFLGAQLAVNATMVSPVRVDGLPRPSAAARDGMALTTLRQRKQRTHPELSGRHRWCRLVVLASETGGRWSLETRGFLHALAWDRAKSEPPLTRRRVEQAWMRWWSILSCTAVRALALSLVDSGGGGGGGLGLMMSFRGLRVMLFSFFV